MMVVGARRLRLVAARWLRGVGARSLRVAGARSLRQVGAKSLRGATLLTLVGTLSPVAAQTALDVRELADYRLTADAFKRFAEASRRIADLTLTDASLAAAPLFTEEVTRSDDAAAAARVLVSRLERHAGLAAALESANITPREYAKFAIALVAARLAHGFLQSGVLKRVPDGAPASNVEFVRQHESGVLAILALLGIRD